MKNSLLVLCLISRLAIAATDNDKIFSFHLFGEPYSVDAATAAGASGSYLFSNIYRGLFRYTNKGLVGEGAKVCRQKGLRLTCELDSRAKWSDGSVVSSDDYVRAFRRIFDPETKSVSTELLLNLKNARQILRNEARLEDLGVRSEGPLRLIFEFETTDPEFQFKLTHPSLAPLKSLPIPGRERAASLVVNGPYQIESWSKGQRLRLKPNPYYPRIESLMPPPVDVLFVDEDSTALRLYETHHLQFLRRVSINDVPALEHRKDFYEQRMARFDYIGFGPQLKDYPELRKALSLSLNYPQLKKLMRTGGMPGCPSLDAKYFDRYPCISYRLKEAKKALEQVPRSVREQKLTIYFSKLGGDSHQTVFEWVQNQWSKTLGLTVEIQSQEQNIVTKTVKSGSAPIFRRGVGLDRPTCLAALEVFQKSNPENFIHFENDKYEKIVDSWPSYKTEAVRRKKCREAVSLLIQDYQMIPLGVVYFSFMARPDFQGWELNELNQLDLSHLTVGPAKSLSK